MRVSKIALMGGLLLALVSLASAGYCSSIPSYYDQLQFNLTAPGARTAAVGGFANPAVYGMLPGGEIQFSWSDRDNRFRTLKEWGLFLATPDIGFGMTRNEMPMPDGSEIAVNDYHIGFALGNRNTSFGLGYGWSGGDDDLAGRSTIFQIGLIHRFNRYASLGLAGNFAIENSNQVGLFDVAVRPIGDDRLTVYADMELPKGISAKDAPWSVGAVIEPFYGIQLMARYFEDDSYSFGLGIGFGVPRLAGSPHFDENNKTTNTTYEIRTGFAERSVISDAVTKDQNYFRLDLKGNVKYRAYRYFDADSHPLLELLTDLEYARTDPSISGVAINLSGANMSRGKAWELREKLANLQKSGKPVVIFADTIDMTTLHLVSVADHVILDPQGIVLIPGYVMGRTFVRDALAKIGVGFDEWRFLKYKSAAEAFSRTSMSEADREQRLQLLEDLYATVRSDVTSARGISSSEFDRWINERILITPNEALEMGIVDRLGRWEEVNVAIRELHGESKHMVGRAGLSGNRIRSRQWRENPRIAVVYALGECDMDKGIRARKLASIVNKLREDAAVAAVVIRVDSPGGQAIASDWVAEAMRKCDKKKPVIVSQGDVAASGGYWLSMYGRHIFALPNTICGSIGVIGGWIWNDGIGDKLGHVADHVQVGDQADFDFGIRLLMSGPQIPDKNLSAEQRQKVIDTMDVLYGEFVEKVASARGMTVEEIQRLAEGRVYSGDRALQIGLVDQIGGLEKAILAARDAASIPADQQVSIVEFPQMPPFKLDLGGPLTPLRFLLLRDNDYADPEVMDPTWAYIGAIVSAPGRPLFMLPPDLYVHEAKGGY